MLLFVVKSPNSGYIDANTDCGQWTPSMSYYLNKPWASRIPHDLIHVDLRLRALSLTSQGHSIDPGQSHNTTSLSSIMKQLSSIPTLSVVVSGKRYSRWLLTIFWPKPQGGSIYLLISLGCRSPHNSGSWEPATGPDMMQVAVLDSWFL